MKLIPQEPPGLHVETLHLDGADVREVACWADPDAGEVGVYGHADNPLKFLDGYTTNPLPVLKSALPRIPTPQIVRVEGDPMCPIYVLSGHVEVTFSAEGNACH